METHKGFEEWAFDKIFKNLRDLHHNNFHALARLAACVARPGLVKMNQIPLFLLKCHNYKPYDYGNNEYVFLTRSRDKTEIEARPSQCFLKTLI